MNEGVGVLRRFLVIFSIVAVTVLFVVMYLFEVKIRNISGSGTVALQSVVTPADAETIILKWNAAGIFDDVRTCFLLDFGFIVAYTWLLFVLTAGRKAPLLYAAIPLTAAFDIAENIFHLIMISSGTYFLIPVSFAMTAAKFALFLLSFGLIIFSYLKKKKKEE
ncbi:MAG: hypothetical protein A2Y33_08710 [Spirochaetes bacterium GWF1_51_8]|nr:MAG: hypothetical protein A2Y33_08710 [Spirochaetes bacterium GWF1_51_8]